MLIRHRCAGTQTHAEPKSCFSKTQKRNNTKHSAVISEKKTHDLSRVPSLKERKRFWPTASCRRPLVAWFIHQPWPRLGRQLSRSASTGLWASLSPHPADMSPSRAEGTVRRDMSTSLGSAELSPKIDQEWNFLSHPHCSCPPPESAGTDPRVPSHSTQSARLSSCRNP